MSWLFGVGDNLLQEKKFMINLLLAVRYCVGPSVSAEIWLNKIHFNTWLTIREYNL